MLKAVCFMMILVCIAAPVCADGQFRVDAGAAIIMEAETGRVLYSQNCDEMLPMASTTKIMTCLLALEKGNLDDVVRAPADACGITGTSIYLTEGESLTLEQLLYGLMLRSGNDAAAAIGIHIAGGQEPFVDMMNDRAEELGIDAHFVNPHGLDAEGHAASARALAEVMRICIEDDDFVRISGTTKKIIPWEGNDYSRLLYNKNRLLTTYEGTIAGKTGYTGRAGRCLVFAAERNGMTLVGCVLNCSSWFDTAEKLLDYCFENYSSENVIAKGIEVTETDVTGGQLKHVKIIAKNALKIPVGLDERYILNIETTPAAAPISAGSTAGVARAFIDGIEIAAVELVYSADVPENDLENAVRRIMAQWVLSPARKTA